MFGRRKEIKRIEFGVYELESDIRIGGVILNDVNNKYKDLCICDKAIIKLNLSVQEEIKRATPVYLVEAN